MRIRHIMIIKKDNNRENRQEIVRTADILTYNESQLNLIDIIRKPLISLFSNQWFYFIKIFFDPHKTLYSSEYV